MKKTAVCVAITPALQRTLTFDRFRRGEVNRVRSLTTSAAGKAVNVAQVLRQLDHPVHLLGFTGGDTGRQLVEILRRLDVPSTFVPTDRPTRIASTLIDRADGSATELVEEAALPSEAEWHGLLELVEGALPEAGALVLCGALPPGADPATYARLAGLAHAAGVPVYVDSQKEPLRACLGERPWLAKLNREELGLTVGREVGSEEALRSAARELMGLGARHLLVTDGARAAHLFAGDRAWRFTPPRLAAVNAVGSGDATTAGFLVACSDGRPLEAAAAYALACGAANALTPIPAQLDPAEAARLAQSVVIEPYG